MSIRRKSARGRAAVRWVAWAVLLALAGCTQRAADEAPAAPYPQKVEAEGLPNVYRLSDRLFSGGSPEGEAGFRSLRRLGVRTVVSVDGARPETDLARRFGLRYAHLPVGYDGVPDAQGRRLARAVRDLPGAVYLHCHHGQHRGPAAAAVVMRCLDGSCDVDRALAFLARAGTDRRYTGLYAAPGRFGQLSAEEIDRVPADFPEAAAVDALAGLMVSVDGHWDRLRQARKAGWKAPPDHPDADPAHEALQLREAYRESARLPRVAEKSPELRRWLDEAAREAEDLERLLGAAKRGGDLRGAEEAFRKVGRSCTRCHGRYRDVPQPS